MPAVNEYLQVALSSVINDKVADVVPAGNSPPGEPLDRLGGVVSKDNVVSVETADWEEILPAAS